MAHTKKLAHEEIIERMVARIDSGDWKPGDKLPPMKRLADEFGLSMSGVREALRIMENRGIVSIEHGRGIFVRNRPDGAEGAMARLFELDTTSLQQLFEARMVVEPELAALCAERAPEPLVRELGRLAGEMAEQIDRGENHFEPDLLFHRKIAEGAANPLLSRMMDAVAELSARGSRDTDKLPHMRTKSAGYHRLIAIAIAERDPAQARLLMQSHIRDMIQSTKRAEGGQ